VQQAHGAQVVVVLDGLLVVEVVVVLQSHVVVVGQLCAIENSVVQSVYAQSPSRIPQNVGCRQWHGAAVVEVEVEVVVVVGPAVVELVGHRQGAAVVEVVVGAAVVEVVVVVVSAQVLLIWDQVPEAADQVNWHFPPQTGELAGVLYSVGAGVVDVVAAGRSTSQRP